MTLKFFVSTFLLLFITNTLHSQPQKTISNAHITANLYLPDKEHGYYRGSRFDWSGVISSLQYKGHEYFGQWFEKYDPYLHDAIMGPVDGYQPIGYDEAKAGEEFLMIGVGKVKKINDQKWFFATPFEIVNHGSWKIKSKPGSIDFTHQLKSDKYSYRYTKSIALSKEKPEMILSYTLKNTGITTIETNVYNHNFFTLDRQITTKGFEIVFPYTVDGAVDNTVDYGRLDGTKIVFTRDHTPNDHVQFRNLTGYGKESKDYDIKIENHNSGACVRITCDQPLVKLAFWSAIKTVCPEPFIHIKVDPGKEMRWNIKYEFFECEEE